MDLAKLKEPFPVAELDWRIVRKARDGKKAEVTAYHTARVVMDRLDEVCGPENWQNAYVPGPCGGVLCRISIRVNDEWVTKEDAAENTDVEAVKGGISDALKRAGVPWGIGRYLYELPSYWVELKNEYGDFDPPINRLPKWAIPAGTARRVLPEAPPRNLEAEAAAIRDLQPPAPGQPATEELPPCAEDAFEALGRKADGVVDETFDLATYNHLMREAGVNILHVAQAIDLDTSRGVTAPAVVQAVRVYLKQHPDVSLSQVIGEAARRKQRAPVGAK